MWITAYAEDSLNIMYCPSCGSARVDGQDDESCICLDCGYRFWVVEWGE